ncbi:MAG TPA: antitoxin [Intrasporangiaceae bacterium]|nr:antitoxin [Intrasporangiaceae bacterium]
MRTTVTLDPDTESLVRRLMEQRGVSFKQALNDAIRAGAPEAARRREFRTTVHRMGVPMINLDRAMQVAGDLEDKEIIHRMRSGQ